MKDAISTVDGEIVGFKDRNFHTCLRNWAITLVFLSALLVCYSSMPSRDGALYKVIHYRDGDRVHIKSVSEGKFVRVEPSSMRTILTEPRAWLHGSTFHVVKRSEDDECFQLRSSYGTWLSVDIETMEVTAKKEVQSEGAQFAAIDSSQEPYLSSSLRLPNAPGSDLSDARRNRRLMNIPSKNVKLKVCTESMWLNVGPSSQPLTSLSNHESQLPPVANQDHLTIKVGVTAPTPTNFQTLWKWWSKGQDSSLTANANSNANTKTNRGIISTDMKSNVDLFTPAVFSLEVQKQWRGVNLGGWFIPEVWMNPVFYNDTGLGWGGSLCGITNFSRSLAEERMRRVIETYITEDDFAEMTSMGFNSVRLPIGYWNVIKDPYRRYAPADENFSLGYIDWAFDTASKYGLTVLLDLHGAPGSQNGQDHSGCSMHAEFLENSDNVKLALQAVRAMAERYKSHPALLGFELLNEPCFAYSQSNHSQLVEYYTNAYRIIRSYSPDSIVVFNELYDFFYPWWDWELKEKDGFYNIILDVHLYDWQQPFTKEPAAQHVTDAMHWKGVIETLSKSHPVVVGEWCMSTGTWRQAGQSFVNAAVKSFDRAAGWYMWTWKIQRGIGFDEWDVQYQHIIHGLDPLQVYSVYDYSPSMDSKRL